MSDALVLGTAAAIERSSQPGLPPVPWRDPHTVSGEELSMHIARLEEAGYAVRQTVDEEGTGAAS